MLHWPTAIAEGDRPMGDDPSLAHPEEMKATVSLRFGDSVSFTATARATPAGLIAAALLISAALVPLVLLVRGRARGRFSTG